MTPVDRDRDADGETLRVAIRTVDGRAASVELGGQLDLDTVDIVEESLTLLAAEGRDQITVDVARLTFCDCVGLGAFVATNQAARATGGHLTLVRPPRQLARLLALAGLDTVLIDPDDLADQHPPAACERLLGTATELIDQLAAEDDLDEALPLLARYLAQAVDGAADASITVTDGPRCTTIAATGPMPERLDALQFELDGGPCRTALDENRPVRTDPMDAELRWPAFAKQAAEQGARRILSVPISIPGEPPIGALSLYAAQPDAFDPPAVLTAAVLANCIAPAVRAVRQRHHVTSLRASLQDNRDIGIAVGIVMASDGASGADAYRMLHQASEQGDRSLVDVAAEIIRTGTLTAASRSGGDDHQHTTQDG